MVVQDNGIAVEPRVVVVGVGGAGCNVVSTFYETMCPIDTIAINTDKAALGKTSADEKLYICKDVLHGEGARASRSSARDARTSTRMRSARPSPDTTSCSSSADSAREPVPVPCPSSSISRRPRAP